MNAQLIGDELIRQAEILKIELGEFEPFGLLLLPDLSLRNVNLVSDETQIKNRIALLLNLLEADIKECDAFGCGVIFEVIYNQTNAFCIQLLSHQSEGWITTYLPFYFDEADGVFEYGNIHYEE